MVEQERARLDYGVSGVVSESDAINPTNIFRSPVASVVCVCVCVCVCVRLIFFMTLILYLIFHTLLIFANVIFSLFFFLPSSFFFFICVDSHFLHT